MLYPIHPWTDNPRHFWHLPFFFGKQSPVCWGPLLYTHYLWQEHIEQNLTQSTGKISSSLEQVVRDVDPKPITFTEKSGGFNYLDLENFSSIAIIYLLVYAFVCGMCLPPHTCGGQRSSFFCLFTEWFPGIELRLSGLAESAISHWAMFPTPDF